MSTVLSPPSLPAANAVSGAVSGAGAGAGAWGPPELDPASNPVPHRRRAPLVVAVVAVLALGVGAFVAMGQSGGEAGVTLPEAQAFSLAAAAQQTVDARTVEFDLTVDAAGLGAVVVSGAVDNETKLMSVSADASSLMGLGDLAGSTGATIEMLLDGESGVVYLSADGFGGLLPSSAPWISVSLDALGELQGVAPDEMGPDLFIDPTETARLLLDTDNAVEVGTETIDGVETRHYEVTVDLAAAIAATPEVESQLGDLDLPALPDVVVYDVWVTADNQLRRASFDIPVADQSVAVTLDMTTSDQPLDIAIPADSDVFDVTGLLGFMN